MAAVTRRNYSLLDGSFEASGGILEVPLLPVLGKVGTDIDGGDPEINGHWDLRDWLFAPGYVEQLDVHSAADLPTMLWFPIPQLRVGTLVSVTARLTGAGGHAGLPASPPILEIERYTLAGGVIGSGTTAIDDSSDTTEYQTTHELTATINAGDFATYRFLAKFRGEAGANALVGLVLGRLYATVRNG